MQLMFYDGIDFRVNFFFNQSECSLEQVPCLTLISRPPDETSVSRQIRERNVGHTTISVSMV